MNMPKETVISLLKGKIQEVKLWMKEDGSVPHPGSWINLEHHDGQIKITAVNQLSQMSRSLVARRIRIDNRYTGADVNDFVEECQKLDLPLDFGGQDFGGYRKGYVLY